MLTAFQISELSLLIIKDGADKELGTIQFQLFVYVNPKTSNEEMFTMENHSPFLPYGF